MSAIADISGTFPQPPIQGNALLVPITSWPEMHDETKVTKVKFDLFWYDIVAEGVAYFFRWLGEPRSTVLVVWDEGGPTHIECRTIGDVLVSLITLDQFVNQTYGGQRHKLRHTRSSNSEDALTWSCFDALNSLPSARKAAALAEIWACAMHA